MSSVGSSKDEKGTSNSRESPNELDRSETCKKRRTQISLLEYFSKRKKARVDVETKGIIFMSN